MLLQGWQIHPEAKRMLTGRTDQLKSCSKQLQAT